MNRVAATGPVPPWALAVVAMLSVQLASALSANLISTVGPAATAWLRLSMGALIFLALARPPLRAIRRRDVPALLGLGVTTGLVTIAFLAAIARIPLGTAVAIEFLGPLTVAAARSHNRRALAWPALALLANTAPEECDRMCARSTPTACSKSAHSRAWSSTDSGVTGGSSAYPDQPHAGEGSLVGKRDEPIGENAGMQQHHRLAGGAAGSLCSAWLSPSRNHSSVFVWCVVGVVSRRRGGSRCGPDRAARPARLARGGL